MIIPDHQDVPGKVATAGALFGDQDPRIVQLNKFTLEVVPEGHMLVHLNYDSPGVIGNIGTTLGDNRSISPDSI